MAEKRPTFSYLPFGLGPKQCLGIRLAELEIKTAMVQILQKMKFERGVDSTVSIRLHASTILGPVEPIRVKVVARSHNGPWRCCRLIMVDGFRAKEDSLWTFTKKRTNVYGDQRENMQYYQKGTKYFNFMLISDR